MTETLMEEQAKAKPFDFLDQWYEETTAIYGQPIGFQPSPGSPMKKRDDLKDVIREEASRGKKRPIDTSAINERTERRDAVLRILRRGTREDLRALLKTWGYSSQEIEVALRE